MIKVGFIGAVSKEWMGGLNYYKNLLFALSTLENKELEVFIFVGKNTDIEIKNMFKQYATVIEDSMFDRKSFKWFLMKIEQKIFNTNFLISNLVNEYKIDIISHSFILNIKNVKIINWIPDFQHLHLVEMFSQKDIKNRNKTFINWIKNSEYIILSSYDALKDLNNFTESYSDKVDVLQFVSQPHTNLVCENELNKNILFTKYNIFKDYFYLPNQFWRHKNHMIVFNAVKELKSENINILVICTGLLNDPRNINYSNEIHDFINVNNLHDNIKLLGLVDYDEVFLFMKYSKAVINPSLFEGWSSTVEECKSIGKNMILSDINVHKEQYPEADFFEKNNTESLKNLFRNYQVQNSRYNINLEARTKKFAEKYIGIVKNVFHEL